MLLCCAVALAPLYFLVKVFGAGRWEIICENKLQFEIYNYKWEQIGTHGNKELCGTSPNKNGDSFGDFIGDFMGFNRFNQLKKGMCALTPLLRPLNAGNDDRG